MADTLAAKTCTPCKGGIPPLTPQEAEGFHRQVSGWDLRDDAHRIERKFKFRKIKGLHENDLILAAKIDGLAGYAEL